MKQKIVALSSVSSHIDARSPSCGRHGPLVGRELLARSLGVVAISTGGAGSVVVVADTVSEHSPRERNRAREEE
jgi:hypothetical protein